MHPYVFHLGHLYLPAFGVAAAAGLLLALALSQMTARLVSVDPDALWDAGIFAVLSAYGLSRLLLALTYWKAVAAAPLLLAAVPSLTPLGLGLTVCASAIWLRTKKIPLRRTLDAWSPCASLVWASLALGHLADGSDPGMPSGTALYAALAAALLAGLALLRLQSARRPGETAGLTLAAAGLVQFLLCLLRQPGAEGWLGLSQLEWLALAMLGCGGCLVAFAPAADLLPAVVPAAAPAAESA